MLFFLVCQRIQRVCSYMEINSFNSCSLLVCRDLGVMYKAVHLGSNYELTVKIFDVTDSDADEVQNEISILQVKYIICEVMKTNTRQKCKHSTIVRYYGTITTENEFWV